MLVLVDLLEVQDITVVLLRSIARWIRYEKYKANHLHSRH